MCGGRFRTSSCSAASVTLRHKAGGLPDEPSIARLDGLIALIINTPITVEGEAFKPVPLSERIRKAGVNAASRRKCRPDLDHCRRQDSTNGLSPIRETVLPLLHGGVHGGGIEMVRILGKIRKLLPQFGEQFADSGAVAVQISRERNLRRGMLSIMDKVQGQKALNDKSQPGVWRCG